MEGFSRDMLETASQASLFSTLGENGRMIRRKLSSLVCTERQKRCLEHSPCSSKPISLSKDATRRRQRC